MSVINTYNLFINSEHRTSGTASGFSIVLFKPISLTSPNNWFSVRIGSAEIPYIFKLINSSNNIVNFTLVRGSTYNLSLTLTPGNYNILTLLTEFATRLGASIKTATSWDPTSLFSFTYDRSTGHATFSIVGTDSTATSITISNNSLIFSKAVGFVTPFTFGYTTPSTRTNAISTQNVNVLQNPAIYIRSESLTQTENVENIVKSSESSDILAKVQVNVQPQSMILWTNPTDLELKITNRVIDNIQLYLGDTNSYELDLDNLNWTARITIKEWGHGLEDLATGMGQTVQSLHPVVEKVMKEKERIVNNLKSLRDQLKE